MWAVHETPLIGLDVPVYLRLGFREAFRYRNYCPKNALRLRNRIGAITKGVRGL